MNWEQRSDWDTDRDRNREKVRGSAGAWRTYRAGRGASAGNLSDPRPDPSQAWECSQSPDDRCWDVFLSDETERDPLPEPGDFWTVLD